MITGVKCLHLDPFLSVRLMSQPILRTFAPVSVPAGTCQLALEN